MKPSMDCGERPKRGEAEGPEPSAESGGHAGEIDAPRPVDGSGIAPNPRELRAEAMEGVVAEPKPKAPRIAESGALEMDESESLRTKPEQVQSSLLPPQTGRVRGLPVTQ